MAIKVVSFHTNAAYEAEARKLRASLEELMIPHAIGSWGSPEWSWKEAVLNKPRFILEAMALISGMDLLWVDADSIFRRVPDWSLLQATDVAAHRLCRGGVHAPEWLTGTMFFRNSPEVRVFVEEWASAASNWRHSDTPEQDAFRVLVEGEHLRGPGHRGMAVPLPRWRWQGVRILELPPDWCWIFDEMPRLVPHGTPTIEHFQASRRLRNAKKTS